jgi:hypothetical protein
MWMIVAIAALLPDAVAARQPPLIATITQKSLLFQRMRSSQLESITAAELAADGPKTTSALRFPSKFNFGQTDVHSIYSASPRTVWVEWYGGRPPVGAAVLDVYPKTVALKMDRLISGKLKSTDKNFANALEDGDLARVPNPSRAIFPVALVAIFDKTCERYEILTTGKDDGTMLCSRITAGSPPTIKHLGKVPCPFEDHFVALPLGESLYFVTATGKLYVSKRDGKGLPSNIVRVDLRQGVRVKGVVIDARVGECFIFPGTEPCRLVEKGLPKFKYEEIGRYPNFSDSLEFADFMHGTLLESKSILPFAEK